LPHQTTNHHPNYLTPAVFMFHLAAALRLRKQASCLSSSNSNLIFVPQLKQILRVWAQTWRCAAPSYRCQRCCSNIVICDLLPSSERSRSGVLLGDWVVHDRPQRSRLTNAEERYAIHSAMAFGVCSVSDVDKWVMRTTSNRWFLFDKPCCFQTLTIDDRQECK
jgi:hypothetical protein